MGWLWGYVVIGMVMGYIVIGMVMGIYSDSDGYGGIKF